MRSLTDKGATALICYVKIVKIRKASQKWSSHFVWYSVFISSEWFCVNSQTLTVETVLLIVISCQIQPFLVSISIQLMLRLLSICTYHPFLSYSTANVWMQSSRALRKRRQFALLFSKVLSCVTVTKNLLNYWYYRYSCVLGQLLNRDRSCPLSPGIICLVKIRCEDCF